MNHMGKNAEVAVKREDMNAKRPDLAESVVDGLREKVESGEDFDHPPEQTPEQKAASAKKAILKKDIIRRANEYVGTPVADRPGKKYLLSEIQQIVDEIDDAFVLVIAQKDGVPYSITFNPNTPEPEDPGIHSTGNDRAS